MHPLVVQRVLISSPTDTGPICLEILDRLPHRVNWRHYSDSTTPEKLEPLVDKFVRDVARNNIHSLVQQVNPIRVFESIADEGSYRVAIWGNGAVVASRTEKGDSWELFVEDQDAISWQFPTTGYEMNQRSW